jgi:hypothetical protein
VACLGPFGDAASLRDRTKQPQRDKVEPAQVEAFFHGVIFILRGMRRKFYLLAIPRVGLCFYSGLMFDLFTLKP